MKHPVFLFALASLSILEGQSQLLINEVVAANNSVPDALGGYHDWIEIHNSGLEEANLKDHYLTDDESNPTKWQFPDDLTISAGEYLLVFASGKDAIIEGQGHTNFKLNNSGESIALYAPNGNSLISNFPQGFPSLRDNQSFGRIDTTPQTTFSVLERTTPRAENSGPIIFPNLDTFTATSNNIERGSPVRLEWSGATGSSLKISYKSIYESNYKHLHTASESSGSLEVFPHLETTYKFEASTNWSSRSKIVSIQVRPSLNSFQFKPQRVAQGGTSAIWWDSGNPNESVALDFGDGFGETIGTNIDLPILYTPSNEVLIPVGSAWRTAPTPAHTEWLNLDFDDSTWNETTYPQQEEATRFTFQLHNSDELRNCIIKATKEINTIAINGEIIAFLERPADFGQTKQIVIPVQYFRTGTNVMAILWNSSRGKCSLSAWRETNSSSLHSLAATATNSIGQISDQFTLSIMGPEEPVNARSLLSINEVDFEVTTEHELPSMQFVELLNHGEESLDLTGFQIVGRSFADLQSNTPNHLQPGELSLIIYDKDLFESRWGGAPDPNGSFRYYPPWEVGFRYKKLDPYLAILDPYGRILDELSLSKFPETAKRIQRVNPEIPFDALGNHVGSPDQTDLETPVVRGTPGEPLFYINSAYLTPTYATPGELVTFRWEFSRPIHFELGSLYTDIEPIFLQEQAGEITFPFPPELDRFHWSLKFNDLQSSYSTFIKGGQLRPELLNFGSRLKRVYTPGEEINLFWHSEFYSFDVKEISLEDGELLSLSGNTGSHTPSGVSIGDSLNYALNLEEAGINPLQASMTVVFEEGDFSYSNWRITHSLQPLDVQDQDKDSLHDLMEYAIGSDPLEHTAPPLKLTWNPSGDLILSYPESLLATDARITLESSQDLVNWRRPQYGLSFLSSLAPKGSTIATTRYRFTGPLAGEQNYFRILITPVSQED